MLFTNWKRIIAAFMVIGLTGCAAMSYLAGVDSHFGRYATTSQQGRAYTHYMAGIFHERRGEFHQAIASWEKVIDLDPEAQSPRLRLVRAYLQRGDYERALAYCKEALEHSPDSPELWILYGELSHRTDDIEAAIEAFMKVIALRPDDLMGYGALLELQERTNDMVAAIDIYEHLIERSPDSAALYYQLGINLARINDVEYAREMFEKVLELEPRITRARFFLALVLFEMEAFQDCAEQFSKYLVTRPGDVPAMAYRAAALSRIGQWEDARRTLELLLATGEAAPKHYLQYAWVLNQQDNAERAQQFALEAGAYLLADIIFAVDALDTTQEDDAVETIWDDRFSLDEVETESDLFVSAVLGLYGETDAARPILSMLDRLEDAVSFSPSLALFRVRVLLYLEQYHDALKILEAIREKEAESKYLHYYSAIAFDSLDDFTGTEYHLRAYLELAPDDPDVLNFLGYLYAEHDVHLDEAEALLQRALKQDPDNPFYLDSLGWIYYRQSRAEEAATLIRRAIYGMESDDAVLRDHLGDVYLLKGDVKRALGEWRRALRLDPSMQEVREKIDAYEDTDVNE